VYTAGEAKSRVRDGSCNGGGAHNANPRDRHQPPALLACTMLRHDPLLKRTEPLAPCAAVSPKCGRKAVIVCVRCLSSRSPMRISWPCCSAGLIRIKRIVGQRTVMRVSRAKIDEPCCKEAEGDYQKRCNTVFVLNVKVGAHESGNDQQ